MIAYRVKIKTPKGFLDRASQKIETVVATQILKDTAPYVPMSGAAAGLSNRACVDGGAVVYPGPYARILYEGKVMVDPNTGSTYAPKGGTKVTTDRNLVFRQDHHGMATDHWFEASKAENESKWLRVARKAAGHEFK